MRFVLCRQRGDVTLVPWGRWKKRWRVDRQFAARADLTPGLSTAKECLIATGDHKLAMIQMLQACGFAQALQGKVKVQDLLNLLEVSSAFGEADPAEYIEDITDAD